jgi:hypothetical protein
MKNAIFEIIGFVHMNLVVRTPPGARRRKIDRAVWYVWDVLG